MHPPHESNWLITSPLIVLAFLAITAGYLNAAPFEIHKFTEWVEPHGLLPLEHAEFEWAKAIPSIVLVALGFVVSPGHLPGLYDAATSRLQGLTKRVAPLRWGYTFLWNKYYLDALYEGVIVHAIAHPIARGAYWVNQNVIDAIVNGVGVDRQDDRRMGLSQRRPTSRRRRRQRRGQDRPRWSAAPSSQSNPARSASTGPCCSLRQPSAPSYS